MQGPQTGSCWAELPTEVLCVWLNEVGRCEARGLCSDAQTEGQPQVRSKKCAHKAQGRHIEPGQASGQAPAADAARAAGATRVLGRGVACAVAAAMVRCCAPSEAAAGGRCVPSMRVGPLHQQEREDSWTVPPPLPSLRSGTLRCSKIDGQQALSGAPLVVDGELPGVGSLLVGGQLTGVAEDLGCGCEEGL